MGYRRFLTALLLVTVGLLLAATDSGGQPAEANWHQLPESNGNAIHSTNCFYLQARGSDSVRRYRF
jgi:hypothetical protein